MSCQIAVYINEVLNLLIANCQCWYNSSLIWLQARSFLYKKKISRFYIPNRTLRTCKRIHEFLKKFSHQYSYFECGDLIGYFYVQSIVRRDAQPAGSWLVSCIVMVYNALIRLLTTIKRIGLSSGNKGRMIKSYEIADV